MYIGPHLCAYTRCALRMAADTRRLKRSSLSERIGKLISQLEFHGSLKRSAFYLQAKRRVTLDNGF